jgi:hypothetical protein
VSAEQPTQPSGSAGAGQAPSEEELRAAYEAELSRITVMDMIAQSTVSLLNMAARRLAPAEGRDPGGADAAGERDLEQVRDAIDAVRALLDILERRIPDEVRTLRDALSRLQMAYAAEISSDAEAGAQTGGGTGAGGGGTGAGGGGSGVGDGGSGVGDGGSGGSPSGGGSESPGEGGERGPAGEGEQRDPRRPGPAESSGRLWVPGR